MMDHLLNKRMMDHLLNKTIAGIKIVDALSLRQAAKLLFPRTKTNNDEVAGLRIKWFRAKLTVPYDAKPIYTHRDDITGATHEPF